MDNNSIFIGKLRSSGLRPTKQRLKICKLLFDRKKTFHFTINDLSKILKKEIDKTEYAAKYNYHVGLYANKDISKGMVIKEEDINCLQPLISPDLYFTGLEVDKIIGMKALIDIGKNMIISRKAISINQ